MSGEKSIVNDEELIALGVVYPSLVDDEIHRISNTSRGQIKAVKELFADINKRVTQGVYAIDRAIDAKTRGIEHSIADTRAAIPLVMEVLQDIKRGADFKEFNTEEALNAMREVVDALPIIAVGKRTMTYKMGKAALDMAKDFLDAALEKNESGVAPVAGENARRHGAVTLACTIAQKGGELDSKFVQAIPVNEGEQYCIVFKNASDPKRSVVVGENGVAMTLMNTITNVNMLASALENMIFKR